MKLNLLQNKIVFLFLFSAFNNTSSAQAQQKLSVKIGAKLMIEANSGSGSTMPFSGFQLVYQKGKHGGLETGLYYRPVRTEFLVNVSAGSTNYTAVAIVSEKFLSIPVLYRFQSRIVNFTAGTSIDLYLGWKDKSDKNTITVNSYNRSATINAGAVVSVSKSIHLSNKLLLEPEIRFNPIFTSGDPYVHSAFGFACRYKL